MLILAQNSLWLCYNKYMPKKIFRASLTFTLVGTLFFLFPPHFYSAQAATANTTFQVNVQEFLSVSIEAPSNWASGDIDTFLRNTVGLTVVSNNAAGFTASMSAQNSTSLSHASKTGTTLSTLASSTTRASFPANRWGYSLKNNVTGNNNTYGETAQDNSNSNYYPITTNASPILILKNNTNGTSSQDIYFGAKSNISQASGTYSGTVVINVVSGVINEDSSSPSYNPTTPTNPATDTTPGTTFNDTTNHRLISTTRTVGNDTTTTETTVTDTYVAPQGVTDSTSSNIYDGSMLTTALAATASVAAASGVAFFILAKRKKDEDEEETT